MEKYLAQLKKKKDLLEEENNLLKINFEKNTQKRNEANNSEINLTRTIESVQRKNKRNLNKEIELNVN